MNLGKSNLAIGVVEAAGVQFVRREYEGETVGEEDWHTNLEFAAMVKLVRDPNWCFDVVEDRVAIANPRASVVTAAEFEAEAVWEA